MLLDDDNCDCFLLFNIGYGMCFVGYFMCFSKVNMFGVDVFYDSGCYGFICIIGLIFYYCICCIDLYSFGGKWRVFWWWNVGIKWLVCEI